MLERLQLSMIFSCQAGSTAMTLPGFASMLMLHRTVGAVALPLKTVRVVGATRDLGKGFGRATGKDFGERHEIGKSMLTSRSPKWAREFSLIRLDSRLFRFTHSRPSSAFLGGQETQSLSQSQPSWEPGGAVVQFVETLMDGPMGPSHLSASPFVPSPLWFFKANSNFSHSANVRHSLVEPHASLSLLSVAKLLRPWRHPSRASWLQQTCWPAVRADCNEVCLSSCPVETSSVFFGGELFKQHFGCVGSIWAFKITPA